ncbi:hypothetical protein CCS05_09750 [Levilactobacillus brevis]|nr:hypothetical protein CCS05_09750 [Levilactobacillus brevis]
MSMAVISSVKWLVVLNHSWGKLATLQLKKSPQLVISKIRTSEPVNRKSLLDLVAVNADQL